MNKEDKLQQINEIFTPSSPIENKDLFSERRLQSFNIYETILEKGKHAVLYGNRGVGKTSLANMIRYFLEDLITIKVTCNRDDNFKTIWERALRKVKFAYPIKKVGYKPDEQIEVIPIQVPEIENITITEIEDILFELQEKMVFIFDEFDIIKNKKTKAQMADIIKLLSDNLPFITIIIVGIAENIDGLLGEHPSIERCVSQINLPTMKVEEAEEMITKYMIFLELKIGSKILDKIIELSSGFPNYLHLLTKHSAQEAIYDNKSVVRMPHFYKAIEKSIENSNHSIKDAYSIATQSSNKQNRFANVLLACALANTDEHNLFSSTDVISKYNEITDKLNKKESLNYNLGMLCKKERAEILTKNTKHKITKYKFKKPLLKAFIKLQAAKM